MSSARCGLRSISTFKIILKLEVLGGLMITIPQHPRDLNKLHGKTPLWRADAAPPPGGIPHFGFKLQPLIGNSVSQIKVSLTPRISLLTHAQYHSGWSGWGQVITQRPFRFGFPCCHVLVPCCSRSVRGIASDAATGDREIGTIMSLPDPHNVCSARYGFLQNLGTGAVNIFPDPVVGPLSPLSLCTGRFLSETFNQREQGSHQARTVLAR